MQMKRFWAFSDNLISETKQRDCTEVKYSKTCKNAQYIIPGEYSLQFLIQILRLWASMRGWMAAAKCETTAAMGFSLSPYNFYDRLMFL